MAASTSRSSSFSPMLSIEPSSDALPDSDFQTSPFMDPRESLHTLPGKPPSTLRRVGPDRRKNWVLF
ncbi:hypothetical protein RU639_013760 [Aspergillus parasiticus]